MLGGEERDMNLGKANKEESFFITTQCRKTLNKAKWKMSIHVVGPIIVGLMSKQDGKKLKKR